jgi:hypothetical protein
MVSARAIAAALSIVTPANPSGTLFAKESAIPDFVGMTSYGLVFA